MTATMPVLRTVHQRNSLVNRRPLVIDKATMGPSALYSVQHSDPTNRLFSGGHT